MPRIVGGVKIEVLAGGEVVLFRSGGKNLLGIRQGMKLFSAEGDRVQYCYLQSTSIQHILNY